MNKIEVMHSSIHINNYELGDCSKIENMFSIYDKLYHTAYMKVLEYIPEKKKLIIPRGVDVPYIEYLFDGNAHLNTKSDEFDRTDIIRIKYLPRDDVQKEALAFMLGEKDYKHTKSKSQLSLNLPTGKGKTYCAIATSAMMLVRSVIITSSINWLNQWKECILEYTDTKHDEIYMLVGSANIHKLLKRDMSKYKYILASHDTIKAFGDKNGWDEITKLFKYMKIGAKFYDEAHLNFDNMAKIDAYTNTFKSFYITATPARSDKDEDVLFKYYFKNVPSIDLFDDEIDPHTNYIALRYSTKPSAFEVSSCMNGYGFDKNKYSQYVVKKENFYKVLRIVMELALKNGKKNVFYVATNNAIKIIYDWIMENYPELHGDVGIFTTVSKDKERELDNRIILSTTKSLGAAIDIKGLKMVVVLAEPFKSDVLAKQTLGRTRDQDTVYLDIVDIGFRSQNDYYKSKKEIFKKYAKSTNVIEVTQNELNERSNKIIQSRIPRILVNPFRINPMKLL